MQNMDEGWVHLHVEQLKTMYLVVIIAFSGIQVKVLLGLQYNNSYCRQKISITHISLQTLVS